MLKPALTALLVLGLVACATPKTASSPNPSALPGPGQQAIYQHGQPYVLASGSVRSLGLVSVQGGELLLELGLSNPGRQPLLFDPQQVRVRLQDGAGTNAGAKVYTFEELSTEDSDAWQWEGANAATSVAGAAIPGGGWVKAAAQAGAHLAIQEGKRQSRTVGGPARQAIMADYLRLHTLMPDTDYRGYLRITLPRPVMTNDRLQIFVAFGDQAEAFEFRFGRRTQSHP